MIQSVGTLYAIQDLYDDLGSRNIKSTEFLTLSKYGTSTAEDVVRTATELGWMITTTDGDLFLTPIADAAHLGTSRATRLRSQLGDMIARSRPAWAAVLTRGRSEAGRSLPIELKQCFSEANLLTTTDDDVVAWWTRVQAIMSDERQRQLNDIGRRGERLTLQYEAKRTGADPRWTSFESSFAGYDVLSVTSSSNPTRLKIEVKTSTLRFRDAWFYVTEHEWQTASLEPERYQFYVWLINGENLLFVLDFTELAKHIPNNRGRGRWRNAGVPVSAVATPSGAIRPAD